jgi:hypothetical protein
MPKQAIAQHVLDAIENNSEGYKISLEKQVTSIRTFMATLPHIFTEAVVRDNEEFFDALAHIDVDYAWNMDEVELLYSPREERGALVDRDVEQPSILDNSLGFCNPVVEEEEQDGQAAEQVEAPFRPHCGEQNIQGFTTLKKNTYYFMANAAVSTQFRIARVCKVIFADDDSSKCDGAYVQYWECSTNTPAGLDPTAAEGANAVKDIDIVTDPWHANSKHIVTGRPERCLEYHLIADFIDEVKMVPWTLSRTNTALKGKGKPPFKKKLWVERGTTLVRIHHHHKSRALSYWAAIIDQK